MERPGYYRFADTEVPFDAAVEAAWSALPDDAALSHISILRWLGFEAGPMFPLHFATARPLRRFREDLVLHRYQGRLSSTFVRGVPLLGPDRTFVDCGTLLSTTELVRVGDWLVAQKHTDPATLRAYVMTSHLDGVQRARRAAELVRDGVESPRETDVRLALVGSGLAEPELNTDIFDDRGRFLARGDLVYRRWKVLVEYDGWHHERDAWQRQKDHLRREALEAAGWVVIVVTTADMRAPKSVAARVARALMSRGYPS
ncbi:DUF559 domain-containing protein [Aeromicrobium ginsengisoli]|nr:DUF559 domain-containing protein [Aeromicrobium ginsengisoli]